VTFCVPDCSGKQCGSDGCGGTCGSCGSGTSCAAGQCAWPDKSFVADVYPLLSANGCAGMGCHGGARPAQGLDLSSAAAAYDALVDVASTECGARLLVATSDPASSYLVDKVLGQQLCSGSKMPKAGTPLSSAEVDTIRAWIGSGAKQ
jgi:hypothetical protein